MQKMKTMHGILPLGTVVTLNKATTRLMIVGRVQKQEREGVCFDYAGVLWPVGLVSSDQFYLFNDEDIETVWFVGLQDQQEFEFRDYLQKQKEEHPDLFR